MSNILIEANNLAKIYDQDLYLKRGINFYAMHNVSLLVESGDFIAIMGPSGSGKSTLLNCISSLDKVTSGSIKLLGKEVSTMKENELSDFRRKYLGFIFQNHNLISSLSIYDNIASPLILNNYSITEIDNRIKEIAKQLKIEDILYKKPSECSGGQRQRAAIARAMVTKPKILICDEPTGNLDSENSYEVLTLLERLNKDGTAIILVTHDNMVASYAKKLMYLRDGTIHTVINRNDASQMDFYQAIIDITIKDSILKRFSEGDVKNE